MSRIDLEQEQFTTLAGRVRRRLLDARIAAGHWEGELSSSALSTATASFALWLYARSAAAASPAAEFASRLAAGGVHWLSTNQNPDGGWGDTIRSRSNISTTALCWAALGAIEGTDAASRPIAAAEAWLSNRAGSTEPSALADAIARRYGDDRTFSVPILTMCALAGRFGSGRRAWRDVPQLPFELAAVPQAWFRFLRLPVVSYALPALIAIGLVRHHHRPTWNPAARIIRRLITLRTLRVLQRVQPAGGGFLEATPLTSFVTMSLIAAGRADHAVVRDGLDFLVRSARPDGSWAIDTNLATWVTTLSVNALGAGGNLDQYLPAADRAAITRWLLSQQYRQRHPYTGAAAGGWAWTDLPGGVPDADDTAGALIALHHLADIDTRGYSRVDDELLDAAAAGIDWLLDLQNRDGGIPTFCRGWGRLPFDRSAPELTAHALHAWSVWRDRLPPALAARVDRAAARAAEYLRDRQRPDGSWVPLWFGNEAAPAEENPTYGTSRVLASLRASRFPIDAADSMFKRATAWLLAAQNSDGGWGGAPGIASSIEETGHAMAALAADGDQRPTHPDIPASIARAVAWMVAKIDAERDPEPAPLGLYFANLWYFERLYPLIAAAAGIGAAARAVQPERGIAAAAAPTTS